jgi:hypothetical protein
MIVHVGAITIQLLRYFSISLFLHFYSVAIIFSLQFEVAVSDISDYELKQLVNSDVPKAIIKPSEIYFNYC